MANSVTQIWYSLRLSEEDYRLVTDTLRDLTQVSSLEEVTGGIMSMNSEQFYRLVQVWRTWLDLSSRKGDWITIERCKMFENDPMANDRDGFLRRGNPQRAQEIRLRLVSEWNFDCQESEEDASSRELYP